MKVLGYVRVSTEDQVLSGAGLEAQRAALEAACARSGFDLEVVMDEGYSAKDLKRPGITSVLERLSDGEAEGLIVARLDRLSRSVLDFATLVERSRKEGWALICLDIGVDTSTASGEVVANVLAAFAQFERRLISERTKAALAELKRQGVHVGRSREMDDETLDRIRAFRSDGRTFAYIAAVLNEERVPTVHGGREWYRSTIKAVCDRYGPSILEEMQAEVKTEWSATFPSPARSGF